MMHRLQLATLQPAATPPLPSRLRDTASGSAFRDLFAGAGTRASGGMTKAGSGQPFDPVADQPASSGGKKPAAFARQAIDKDVDQRKLVVPAKSVSLPSGAKPAELQAPRPAAGKPAGATDAARHRAAETEKASVPFELQPVPGAGLVASPLDVLQLQSPPSPAAKASGTRIGVSPSAASGKSDAGKSSHGAVRKGSEAGGESSIKVADDAPSAAFGSSKETSAPQPAGANLHLPTPPGVAAATASPTAFPSFSPLAAPTLVQRLGHSSAALTPHAGVQANQPIRQGLPGYAGPMTLTSSPNVVEIAMASGAHGWLRVRAELGHTGEVTASLVASNAGSARTLSNEAGAITDYLKSASVGVTSLVVTAPEHTGAMQSATGYGLGGAGSDGTGSTSRDGRGEHQAPDNSPTYWPPVQEVDIGGFVPGLPGTLLTGTSGGWVNVVV